MANTNNQSDKIASLLSMLDAEEEITVKNQQTENSTANSYEEEMDDLYEDDYEDYDDAQPASTNRVEPAGGSANVKNANSGNNSIPTVQSSNTDSAETDDEDIYEEDDNTDAANNSVPAGNTAALNKEPAAMNVQPAVAPGQQDTANQNIRPSIADNIMNGIKGNGGLGGIAGKISNINLNKQDRNANDSNALSAGEMDSMINNGSSQYANDGGLSSNPVFDVFTSKQKKLQQMEEDRVMSQAYKPNTDGYYDDRLPKLVDEVMAASIGSVILKIALAIVCVAAVIVYCIYFVGI